MSRSPARRDAFFAHLATEAAKPVVAVARKAFAA